MPVIVVRQVLSHAIACVKKVPISVKNEAIVITPLVHTNKPTEKTDSKTAYRHCKTQNGKGRVTSYGI